ncbi:MAG TPA: hypothetical protein ENK19_04535 [Acidobacteria bacterium]|nr:hypothetical protein [Acidobacteriota bacterium]
MRRLLLVGLLTGAATWAGAAGRPKVVHPQVLSYHEVVSTKAGAIVGLTRDSRGVFHLGRFLPFREPLKMWIFPEPMGDGTWIQLLSRGLRPLITFRAAVPAPGSSCGVEVPLIRGAWWMLIYQDDGGMRRLVAHLQVGPRLAQVARRYHLPVLGEGGGSKSKHRVVKIRSTSPIPGYAGSDSAPPSRKTPPATPAKPPVKATPPAKH